MGGRGASFGVSSKGKRYGTEYKTVLKSGNIKFIVQKSGGSVKPPMETMTRGRVYVTVDREKQLRAVTYYDNENKRSKTIDLMHKHNGLVPHTHHGYLHAENEVGKKGGTKLTIEEKKMLDRVYRLWENRGVR